MSIPKLSTLTPNERRILAAELLGWHWEGGKRNRRKKRQNFFSPRKLTYAILWQDGMWGREGWLPNPDNSHKDAFALVDHMRANGHAFDISTFFRPSKWMVRVTKESSPCGAIETELPKAIVSACLVAAGVALPEVS